MTISGPAIKAAKNPSIASTFIALPSLQPLRKSPRRSSSASVRGSFWVKVFTGTPAHHAKSLGPRQAICSAPGFDQLHVPVADLYRRHLMALVARHISELSIWSDQHFLRS